MPTISVIVPTFNRANILSRTLDRLSSQSLHTSEYEIIVIDDGSCDNTGHFLKNFNAFSNFTYVINPTTLGRSKTRNIGIEHAHGQFSIFIDDDIMVEDDLLQAHLNVHYLHNTPVAVVGSVLPASDIPNTAINDFINIHHLWCHNEMIKHQQLPFTFCKTANLSIKTDVLKQIGMFDESFVTYGGEDTDLGCRLHKYKIPILYANNAVGYHYHNESITTFVNKTIELGQSEATHELVERTVQPLKKSISMRNRKTKNPLRLLSKHFVKMLLYTDFMRIMNVKLITRYNQSKHHIIRHFLLRFFLPMLKMQCLYFGKQRAFKKQQFISS